MRGCDFFRVSFQIAIFICFLAACAGPPIKEEFALGAGGDEYILGSEDVLEIAVWKEDELTRVVTIRPDGKISLPLVGDVQAEGLTAEELKEVIENSLVDYVDNPSVSVIVQQINSLKIYVQGEVANPGVLELKSNTSLLQAVSLAGGFTEWARKDRIAIIRKSGDTVISIPIDYEKILSGKDLSQNVILRRGDTIIVP